MSVRSLTASVSLGAWQLPRRRPSFKPLAAGAGQGQQQQQQQGSSGGQQQVASDLQRCRVLAVTDLHVDYSENMRWLKSISSTEHRRDVLIIAGDVSDDLAELEEALGSLASKFGAVFYTPGNHCLWLRKPTEEMPTSLQKLEAVWDLCERVGCHWQPRRVGGRLWVVPLLSWHHQSFDQEPDIPGIPPVSRLTIADYTACKWPSAALGFGDGQGGVELAEWFDAQNDPDLWETVLRSRDECDVISFSHFLPSQALLPEKRFLYYPGLPKAVGSLPLGRRVQQLQPDIHVFGHTHFAWDATINGVRYIQAPLCSPLERKKRLFTVGFHGLGMEQAQADPLAASWLPIQIYECQLPEAALPLSGDPGAEHLRSSMASGSMGSMSGVAFGSSNGGSNASADEEEVASIDHAVHGIVSDESEEELPLDNPLEALDCSPGSSALGSGGSLGSTALGSGSSPGTRVQPQPPAASNSSSRGGGSRGTAEEGAAALAAEVAAVAASSPSSKSSNNGSSSSSVPAGEGAVRLRHGWMPGPLGAHWSHYYDVHPRTPECIELAPWVARVYAKRLARRAAEAAARQAEGATPASRASVGQS